MGVKKEMTNLYQAGKEEGIAENKVQIAKRLLNKNMDLKEISEVTDLSKEQIERIKEKTQH